MYQIGDSVTVTAGSMANTYGVIVYHNPDDDTYLVRFNAGQVQLFYSADQIMPWK